MRSQFRFKDLSIGVSSDDGSHLEWLEEFLSPQFRAASEGTADCEVTLRFDEESYRGLLENEPAGGVIDCFALDTRMTRFPLLHSTSGRLVLDEEYGVLYRVSQGAREVEIIAPANRHLMRLPLMRVVREFAMNHIQRNGKSFLLHAFAPF